MVNFNTKKCESCKYHDHDWKKYSQLVTCRHPKSNICGVWSLYALGTFCIGNSEYEPSTEQIQTSSG